MDTGNKIVQLCVEGTRSEYAGRIDEARLLYWQAWLSASSDFEKCVAAHYVARFQDSAEATLHWNQAALQYAHVAKYDDVKSFYPSLYLNMGQSYALLGNSEEAQRYYDLAASFGVIHTSQDQEQPPCRK